MDTPDWAQDGETGATSVQTAPDWAQEGRAITPVSADAPPDWAAPEPEITIGAPTLTATVDPVKAIRRQGDQLQNTIRSVGDLLSTSVLPEPREIKQDRTRYDQNMVPYQLPARAPQQGVTAAMTGAAGAVADFAKFFSTPLGAATLGIGGLEPAVQKAIAAGFSAQMASQLPELGTALGEELAKPESERDTAKIAKLVTEAGLNIGMSTAGAFHVVKEAIPEISNSELRTPEIRNSKFATRNSQLPAEEGAPVPEWAAEDMAQPVQTPGPDLTKGGENTNEPTNQEGNPQGRQEGLLTPGPTETGLTEFTGLPAGTNPENPVNPVKILPRHLKEAAEIVASERPAPDYTLRDAASEAGGVSGPPLPEALAAMKKGRTPAQIVADWGGGQEYDALHTILEQIHEAKGPERKRLVAAYQDTFRGKSKADQVVSGIDDAAYEGRTPPGGVPQNPSELIEGLWHEAAGMRQPNERRVQALAEEIAMAEQGKETGLTGATGLPESPNPDNPVNPVAEDPFDIGPLDPNDPELIGMGGAIPAEFARSQQSPTSIKNANVDLERAQRGLPPAVEPLRRSFGQVWDEAMAGIDADPGAPDRLIAELRDRPRALTDREDAVLLHRQVDLQNEYGKVTRDLAQAYDDAKQFPNRLADVEELKLRAAKLSDDLLDLYNVNKAVGTETGRGLAARKMLAYEDFTLANMELQKRAANDGAPLTEAQHAEIVKLQEKIATTQKAFDDYVAKQEADKAVRQSREETDALIAQVKNQPGYDRNVQSLADRIVTALEREADKARDRLKAKFARTSAGVDPTILGDLAIVGAAKISRGVLDFTRWSKLMVDDFGPDVVPWLNQAWARANAKIDDAVKHVAKGAMGEQVKARVKKTDTEGQRAKIEQQLRQAAVERKPLTELGDYVRKLAENFVRSGIHDRDALIDAVHGVLKEEFSDQVTRRETMDAISGYGDFKPLNPDKIKVELRDLKGQMQQLAKLEDIQARQPLQKSGLERRSLSDIERRLIQQVNEAKKKFGVVVTDPARQLKSALDAVKKRLTNSIADLEFQIATRTRTIKQRTPTPWDAESKLLEARRDELKAQFQEMFAKPDLTDAQRTAIATRTIERSIADYETRIKAGDVADRAKRPTVRTAELDQLRARRDALKAEFEELRDANLDYQRQQQAAQLQRQKKALEQSIAETTRKLASGEIQPEAQQVARPADPALEQLMQQRDALNRQLAEARKTPAAQKYAEQLARKLETMQKAVAERQAKLKAGDLSRNAPPTRASRPLPTPELELARQQLDEVNRQLAELRAPTMALSSIKRQLAQRAADYTDRLAREDFTPRPRKPIRLDDEAQKLKATAEAAKQEFQRGLLQDRLSKRTGFAKAMDGVAKWSRTGALSWPTTLGKLTFAAAEGIGITPLEEVAGTPFAKTFGDIAKKAPRHGGLNVRAEARAISETLANLVKDFNSARRTGSTELDYVYGKPVLLPRELKDAVGNWHYALKTPLMRNEFARSLQKLADAAAARGVDITEPLVQQRLGNQAYQLAQKAIFKEDNLLTNMYRRALSATRAEINGQRTRTGIVAEAALRWTFPIVDIPTTIVKRTFEYALGAPTGLGRAGWAYFKGIENLHPDEAEAILRNLKRGSLGAVVLALGFFNAKNIGGYYQPREKRDETDVKAGGVRLFGQNIPRWMVHNPLLEQLQIGATMRRVADAQLRKHNEETKGIGEGAWAALLGLVEETPFLNTTGRMLKNPTPGNIIGEQIQSAVPGAIQWTAKELDLNNPAGVTPLHPLDFMALESFRRKPMTLPQHVLEALPGLRQQVPINDPEVTRQLRYHSNASNAERLQIAMDVTRDIQSRTNAPATNAVLKALGR